MSAAGLQVIRMLPTAPISNEQLESLKAHLKEALKEKEVLDINEVGEMLGIGATKMYSIPKSVIPYHKLEGIKKRFYLRSELIDIIKKS